MTDMAIPHCHRRGHDWRRNLERMLAFAERGETDEPRGPGRGRRHHHGPLHGPFPGRRGRGPRARRGDVRAAILLLLADEPRNGYALMQAIEERTGGVWRPSPGSVSPRSPSSRTRASCSSRSGRAGAPSASRTPARRTSRSTGPSSPSAGSS